MANENSTVTSTPTEAGFEMPTGEMRAPPGPSLDMPSGEMPGEELSAFTPATGEMPRSGMEEPAGMELAGFIAGVGAAALSDMPGGEMSAVVSGQAAAPEIEISGTWRLQLSSNVLKSAPTR
jgi:hypothetical protein